MIPLASRSLRYFFQWSSKGFRNFSHKILLNRSNFFVNLKSNGVPRLPRPSKKSFLLVAQVFKNDAPDHCLDRRFFPFCTLHTSFSEMITSSTISARLSIRWTFSPLELVSSTAVFAPFDTFWVPSRFLLGAVFQSVYLISIRIRCCSEIL